MTQKDGRLTLAVCLVLGLGTIGLYAPAFSHNFVNFDDLLGNPHLKKGLGDTFAWAIQPSNSPIWQPLTWLSHALDYQLYEFRPAGHHATNLILHALNSVLVFLVLRRLTGVFWRSAAVAAFFAWHPLHVEAVAWVAQRSGLLSAFFWLLAIWAYARYAASLKSQIPNSKLFYAGALILFALALMSNSMAVTLPLILLVLDWWPLGRMIATPERPAGKQAAFLVLEKIPFLALSCASIVMSWLALERNHIMDHMVWLPFRLRFATAGMSCFHYLAKSCWPGDLAANYPFVLHWAKLDLIGAGLVLLAISVVAFWVRKTRPFWLTGWVWFLLTLFPVLNLVVPGSQTMADRYMYIPSIGLWMLFCWEASDLAALSRQGRTALAGVCAALLVVCCVLSWIQLGAWKNEGTLLARIPESASNSAGHADYAAYLLRVGQLPQAQAECEKAMGIASNAPAIHVLLGDILLVEGKPDNARQEFQSALRLNPRADIARMGLGRVFLAKKQVNDAVQEFKTVAFNEPKNMDAHNWLARSLLVQGKPAEAITEFGASLKLQVNQPETLNELAWLLATSPHPEIRKGAEAVQLAARACDLSRGQEPAFLGTLAAALAETGDFDKAVKLGEQAHDLALKQGRKALADTNLQLIASYKAHKPWREKQ